LIIFRKYSNFIKMRRYIFLLFILVSTSTFSQELNWHSLEAEGEPLARHENALIAAGGKLILIGGRGEKPLDIYDPAAKTWSKGATPPFEIHHMQAVTLDGLIYILGAFTGSWPNETPLSHVLIYEVATDTWIIGPEIPENRRRGAAGVVVYKNKVYLVNGIINGHSSGWVNWLDEYDPYTGSWKTLASSPQARDHFQAAVIEDKLYVAGGRRSGSTESGFGGTVAATNVYDFKTNSWEVVKDIPTPRAGTAATVLIKNM
jgi:N-acetylneuraminic acid mutarotase